MYAVKKILIPSGRTHSKYFQYIGWSFVSNIIVSTQSVLSVHSMLSAIDSNSSESIRTANYVGKDVIGQIGSLWYISKMGKKADKESKKFLLYSNIIQQASYIITSSTPMFSFYFLPTAGFANIMSNISFTGLGAINAKCVKELAVDDNIGEIYAKISVINTFGSSIGMIFGLIITTYIPEHNLRLCLIPILGVFRVYTFNKAVKDLL